MFRQFKDSARIFRQEYSGGKSSYADTGSTCIGYLHPMSPERNQISPEKFGKEFSFTTATETDVRESDRLEISGTYYRVKWVGAYTGIVVRTKRVNLVKEEPWT